MPPPTYPIGCYSPTSTQQCRVELTQRLSSIQVCYSLGFLCQSFTRLERVRISFLSLSYSVIRWFWKPFSLGCHSLVNCRLATSLFLLLDPTDFINRFRHRPHTRRVFQTSKTLDRRHHQKSQGGVWTYQRKNDKTSVPPVFAKLSPTSLTIIISRSSFEQTTFSRAIFLIMTTIYLTTGKSRVSLSLIFHGCFVVVVVVVTLGFAVGAS